MKFYKFRRLSAYIPAVIVAIFLFSFVHSELGLFNYDHGDHSEHDHCEIVQTTNIPGVSFKVPQPKLEINKFLSENINLSSELCDIIRPVRYQNHPSTYNLCSEPVYILHRSLLI
jgi:hypothetical protein